SYDPGVIYIHSTGSQAAGNAFSDPSARFTRVLANHHFRVSIRFKQIVTQGPADPISTLDRQGKFPRDPANSICTKQLPFFLRCHYEKFYVKKKLWARFGVGVFAHDHGDVDRISIYELDQRIGNVRMRGERHAIGVP